MLTIGFANHFYTLWNVTQSIRYGAGTVLNGVFHGESFQVTTYIYHHNLSMDLEAAKAKVQALVGDAYEIDLDLRGAKRFERTVRQINAMAVWQFTFGRCSGQDMRISEDAFQLRRAMNEEPAARRRVIARQRLVELGLLVRYSWIEDVFDADASINAHMDAVIDGNDFKAVYRQVRRSYATPKQREWKERAKAEAAAGGHFYNEGDKVELLLKRAGGFSFETNFGTTYVEKYITEDGRMFKYMGGTPLDIAADVFTRVRGTVKHAEYKGVPETRLQRMKKL